MTFVLHGAHKIHSQDLYKLDDAKHKKIMIKEKLYIFFFTTKA
jgi:hypothetical protein